MTKPAPPLSRYYDTAKMELAGEPPAFYLAAAGWATARFYAACQLLAGAMLLPRGSRRSSELPAPRSCARPYSGICGVHRIRGEPVQRL